jgi:eukaryotic-like serine/threonine-protein kinase
LIVVKSSRVSEPLKNMALISAPLTKSVHFGLTPGAIVGEKYRIDGVLGEGGMGVVLSATHLELGSAVAIKVVRDDLAANEAIVSRLIFEARAVARMSSIHIVRVLDVAWLPTGAPYIVMEQLHGWDLATALAKRGVFSLGEAVGSVLQACEGLAEAHQLGIIHRDLKPENLFLATTPEGVVLKILDFGISKDTTTKPGVRSTLTKKDSAVGSPLYMAPEQMRASPNLDARADIWSLGCILFELLAGRCPFEADSPAALCAKVLVDEAPSLLGLRDTVPEQLDDIVRRCLQKEPDKRFQTVTELAGALRAFVAAHAEQMRTAELHREQAHAEQERPARPRMSKKIAFGALTSAVLLVSVTAAIWREHSRSALLGWVAPRHADASELPRAAPLRAARAPAAESPPTVTPVAEYSAPPEVSLRPAPTEPKRVVARTVRPGPLYYVPTKVEPATPKSEANVAAGSVSARYGL